MKIPHPPPARCLHCGSVRRAIVVPNYAEEMTHDGFLDHVEVLRELECRDCGGPMRRFFCRGSK